MNVDFIPDKRIERAADGLLADYGETFTQIAEPPVPVEEILECHLDLSLGFEDLEHRLGEPSILGATWIDEKEVLVDASLDPTIYPIREGRYRFTVAHEVGHWVLHRHALQESKWTPLFDGRSQPSIVCCNTAQKPRIEIQADLFASYLLMPRNWYSNTGKSASEVFSRRWSRMKSTSMPNGLAARTRMCRPCPSRKRWPEPSRSPDRPCRFGC